MHWKVVSAMGMRRKGERRPSAVWVGDPEFETRIDSYTDKIFQCVYFHDFYCRGFLNMSQIGRTEGAPAPTVHSWPICFHLYTLSLAPAEQFEANLETTSVPRVAKELTQPNNSLFHTLETTLLLS